MLAAVAVFVVPAIGGEVGETPGGEGGLVNVPAIARAKPTSRDGATVCSVRRPDYHKGLTLVLPPSLKDCVAVVTVDGHDVIWGAFETKIVVNGDDLALMRASAAREFEVRLLLPGGIGRADMHGPRIVVRFDADGTGFRVDIY